MAVLGIVWLLGLGILVVVGAFVLKLTVQLVRRVFQLQDQPQPTQDQWSPAPMSSSQQHGMDSESTIPGSNPYAVGMGTTESSGLPSPTDPLPTPLTVDRLPVPSFGRAAGIIGLSVVTYILLGVVLVLLLRVVDIPLTVAGLTLLTLALNSVVFQWLLMALLPTSFRWAFAVWSVMVLAFTVLMGAAVLAGTILA